MLLQVNSALHSFYLAGVSPRKRLLICYKRSRGERVSQVAQPDVVEPLGWEDPLEQETATHSRILVWEIPRTEGTGRLQTQQRVGNDLATKQ